MKFSKLLLSATLLIVFFTGTISSLWAQRNISYSSLAMRSQQEPVSFDFIILPGDNENTVKFTSLFSLSYSYLPFKKVGLRSSEYEFYSTASISLEVFDSDKSENNRKNENISVEGLDPAGRAFWADTAFAKTYGMSKSKNEFLNGYLNVTLSPGTYNFVLQMKRGDQTDSRVSKTQVAQIESYTQMKTGNVILGEDLITDNSISRLKLNSLGDRVRYAKDFYALAYIPNYEPGASYTLKVISLEVTDSDTSREGSIYSKELGNDDIKTGLLPKIASSEGKTYLNLYEDDKGFAYALVKIPNSDFPNSFYRLVVEKENQEMPVSEDKFRSLWIDMPASLYNLDVAVEMLQYIADKETIKNLSEGTQAEREKKFREFWKERDPTPKTEFNELMAEYYRRIDYAYENFTTENRVGYESDQGKIYIKYGPPNDIDRKYPTSGATTEIWTYPNRRFVFKATTGFGDFKLVTDR